MDNENSIFRSLEIIENHITEKLTVENIASGVYFSKYHYQRLFREIVGDSVMEYVTKRRLTLAGRALLETDATILDIALDYGYDSREGFARSFKAYMGVTPTEYRKYGLASISQKTVKEKCNMLYSKTTDEIIRELNDFIVKAKETAKIARRDGAADIDGLRNPKDKALFDGLSAFNESVAETVGFFKTLVKPESSPILKRTKRKILQDIAFQMNLMLFYTRGEVSDEKLGKILDEDQKNTFDAICEKMNSIIQFMHNATEETSYKEAADRLYEITSGMTKEADKLNGHGGAVRFLADEIRSLADRVVKYVLG